MRANSSSHLSARVPLGALPVSAIDARRLEVTHRWGDTVVGVHRFAIDDVVTIGSAVDDDIAVGTRSWTLLSGVLRIDGSMHGTITRRGQTLPLTEAASGIDDDALAIVWSDDAAATIAIGPHTLQLCTVQRAPVASMVALFDALWANAALLATFATSVLLAAAFFFPIDIERLDDELQTNPGRFAKMIFAATPKPPRSETPAQTLSSSSSSSSAAASTTQKTATKLARSPSTAPAKTRSNDAVVADAFARLFGSDGVAQVFGYVGGAAMSAALGSLNGTTTAGTSTGVLGIRGGTGVGVGAGRDTVGDGRISTRGRDDKGYGAADDDIGAHAERDVVMTSEPPKITGSIDAEAVRRVVRSHAGQIRYCYERALQHTPGLAGKVVMKWTIDATGHVQHAVVAESQLQSVDVETCMASRIKTWVFPSLKGGGITVINYPFMLRQSA